MKKSKVRNDQRLLGDGTIIEATYGKGGKVRKFMILGYKHSDIGNYYCYKIQDIAENGMGRVDAWDADTLNVLVKKKTDTVGWPHFKMIKRELYSNVWNPQKIAQNIIQKSRLFEHIDEVCKGRPLQEVLDLSAYIACSANAEMINVIRKRQGKDLI